MKKIKGKKLNLKKNMPHSKAWLKLSQQRSWSKISPIKIFATCIFPGPSQLHDSDTKKKKIFIFLEKYKSRYLDGVTASVKNIYFHLQLCIIVDN